MEKAIKGKVSSISNITSDVLLIKINLENEIHFKSGQYIGLKLPNLEGLRYYSIASNKHDTNNLEIVVRLVPNAESSNYFSNILKEGDEIKVFGPFGEFYLRNNNKKVLLIAGGTGISAIRSILFDLEKEGFKNKTEFYFGVRKESDLLFNDVFKSIENKNSNFKYYPTLSEQLESKDFDLGLVTNSISKYFSNEGSYDVYICGPRVMVDASLELLKEKGVKEEDIYFDKF